MIITKFLKKWNNNHPAGARRSRSSHENCVTWISYWLTKWKNHQITCKIPQFKQLLINIQGVFFYWSALKMTKCQTLRKFWHIELFRWDLFVILKGRPVKNHPVYPKDIKIPVRQGNDLNFLLIALIVFISSKALSWALKIWTCRNRN